ncbi:hypothetical protein HTV45_19550 [Streptomyces sp. CHD11]|nr:hypothetical protein [Streptomyces sp. CHD11]
MTCSREAGKLRTCSSDGQSPRPPFWCGEEYAVHIGDGHYGVHTGVVCVVSGRVTRDELTTEVHGAYTEPRPGTGPWVKNRGGH